MFSAIVRSRITRKFGAGVAHKAMGRAAAICLLASVSASAAADTIHVPGDQPTIQAGINAASADDVVLVAAGTYNESINFFGKAITVRSADGPATTIIDADGQNDAAVVFITGEGASSVLEGFTIQGGDGRSVPLFPFGSVNAGGGIFIDNASPTILDCVISENTTERGAGMYCANGAPFVLNTTFENNSAGGRGGAVWLVNASAIFEDCAFTNNQTTTSSVETIGGAVAAQGGQPMFRSCEFFSNTSAGNAGAMHIGASTGTIDDCVFFQNNAAIDGGAMIINGQNMPTVKNSRFLSNEANAGGAVIVQFAASAGRGVTNARMINCVFAGNEARGEDLPLSLNIGGGGLVVALNGRLRITNSTFHNNRVLTSLGRGGGIAVTQNAADLFVTNSIFWANTAPVAANEAARQIFVAPAFTGTFGVTYSCIQDEQANDGNIPFGGAGNNNIDAYPMFADPAGPDGQPGTLDDDLALTADSPCRDTGDTDADDLAGIDFDIAGTSRVVGSAVDMGAYEYKPQCRGDVNNDNLVNVLDLLLVISNWGNTCDPGEECPGDENGDGVVNVTDLLQVIGNWGADCSAD